MLVIRKGRVMDNEIASELFKVLSDKTRLIIIEFLIHKDEVCACKLLELVDCNQSTLSHHMKVLVNSKLVIARKDWKWMHYSINYELLNDLFLFLKK